MKIPEMSRKKHNKKHSPKGANPFTDKPIPSIGQRNTGPLVAGGRRPTMTAGQSSFEVGTPIGATGTPIGARGIDLGANETDPLAGRFGHPQQRPLLGE